MLPGPRGAERVHPNVILAVLSLAAVTYAVLSSAVIPALPTIQRDLHASETGVTWLLTGFLLSASVGTAIIGKLGGHRDHRQARRHVRQAAAAALTGFTTTFAMAAVFLACCAGAGLLIPARSGSLRPAASPEAG